MPGRVLIIGGGPAGLTLAIELGRRGVPVLLIDDKPGVTTLPAANATQARSMEHFRRLGLAEAIRARGLPPDHPTDVAYFTRFGGHELARFRLPSSAEAAARMRGLGGSWSAAEPPHRISQMYVEAVLHAAAARLADVRILKGFSATGFSQDQDGVAVTVERVVPRRDLTAASHAIAADKAVLRGAFLVGADGPRSMIRKGLGIGFVGGDGQKRDFMGGRMLALFLRAPGLAQRLPHDPAWMRWAVNRQRRAFMAAIDGQALWVFHTQLRDGEAQVTDREARSMLADAFGAPPEVEIIARAPWTAGLTLHAERLSDRRVFLVGDAAHLFTPTGGLGYNTAIEDAVNLGWKLAALCHGVGGPALAASYHHERLPLIQRNLAFSRGFADSVGGFVPDPAIEDATPAGEAARAAAGAHLNDHARREFDIPGITFGGRVDGSPIILPDGTAPPADAANRYVPSATPGGRAPHAWLADGRSLFDVFGFGFTLLCLGDRAPDVPGVATRRVPGLRDLYGADFALIRPDQVVAWRGDDPAEVAPALRVAVGH